MKVFKDGQKALQPIMVQRMNSLLVDPSDEEDQESDQVLDFEKNLRRIGGAPKTYAPD